MSYLSVSKLIVFINNSFMSNKRVFFIKKNKYLVKILNLLKDTKIIKTFFYKEKTIMCIVNFKSLYKKIILISKSSKKVYFNLNEIKKNLNKNYLISTNKGIKKIKECKRDKIGGEVILMYY
ncbi:30S ribosomal protein S8 [Candidatus Vidania fulgoroideorum]